MKKVIYVCDQCARPLGPNAHITLVIGLGSGWAYQVRGAWEVRPLKRLGTVLHFCDGECLCAFIGEPPYVS